MTTNNNNRQNRSLGGADGSTRMIAGLIALLIAAVAGEAQADELTATAPTAAMGGWQGSAGVRTSLIKDRGFDPFATTDALPQLSVSVARVLVRGRRAALTVGLGADTGTSDATARGAQAHLRVVRASVPLELRYQAAERVYVFGRAAPGVLNVAARLTDPSAPAPLSADFNALSLDGSVGIAARVTPAFSRFGLWVQGDGGYGWTPSHDLVLAPDLTGADKSKAGALTFSPLAARGAFFRLALAVSY
ncbi:MAG TPA: hypothetical protein VGL59_02795 [Polyangia bacterium]|jgi:hypothetical protein